MTGLKCLVRSSAVISGLLLALTCILLTVTEGPASFGRLSRPADGHQPCQLDLTVHQYCVTTNHNHIDLCPSGHQIDLLILIHSAVSNSANRDIIRSSIKPLGHHWKAVFLLGKSTNATLNHQVKLESDTFSDVLQANFVDTYRNLTLKHIFALACSLRYCPQAKFVLKMDDDIFVNYYLLKKYLDKTAVDNSVGNIWCYRHHNMLVIRNSTSKWHVSEQEYPAKYYPDFCSGWAYIAQIEAIKSLVCQLDNKAVFWIDDVFITGMLRQRIAMKRLRLNSLNHLFNIDLELLVRWLTLNPTNLKWNYLFSNTNGDVRLLREALQLNHALTRASHLPLAN